MVLSRGSRLENVTGKVVHIKLQHHRNDTWLVMWLRRLHIWENEVSHYFSFLNCWLSFFVYVSQLKSFLILIRLCTILTAEQNMWLVTWKFYLFILMKRKLPKKRLIFIRYSITNYIIAHSKKFASCTLKFIHHSFNTLGKYLYLLTFTKYSLFQSIQYIPSTERMRYITFIPNHEIFNKNTLSLDRCGAICEGDLKHTILN